MLSRAAVVQRLFGAAFRDAGGGRRRCIVCGDARESSPSPSSSSSTASSEAEDPLSPARVLSAANRARCVAALENAPSPRPRRPPRAAHGDAHGDAHGEEGEGGQGRRAAVLVPLCLRARDGELCLLYTLRNAALRSYAGHVAFPGGMQEAGDGGSSEATALREAAEELGLGGGGAGGGAGVEVWGAGPWVGSGRGDAAVRPVLAFVGRLDVAQLRLCRREVQAAFAVPLRRLCDPRHFGYTHFRGSYVLPVFTTAAEYRIWGLTAIITHLVLKALLPDIYPHQLPKMKYIVKASAGRKM